MSDVRRTWRRRVIATGVLWFVVCAAGYVFAADPQPGLIALVLAAAAGTLWLYLDVSAQAEPVSWAVRDDDPVRQPGEDPRLAFLGRLVSEHLDAKLPNERLHTRLVDVTDRRLVAHHGISRLADPARAASVLGPELAAFVDDPDPAAHRMTVREIDRLITRIEEL